MKSFELNIKYSGQSFKNIQRICKPHITNCLAAYFFFEAYKYNSTGNGVKKNIQQQQGQQQMLFKQSQNELEGKKKIKGKQNEMKHFVGNKSCPELLLMLLLLPTWRGV